MNVRDANYGTGYDVMGVGVYPASSVLAGQDKIVFLDSFESLEECEAKYPTSTDTFHGEFTAPRNTFDHLPDEGDGW